MINKDVKMLLQKADELRALFVLGQRVIPFLEEIFIFVSEIQPLLDDINHSIQENLKKMPNASKQLSKVTEATELATNEIMDIVDGLVYKVDIISANIKKIQEIDKKKRDNPIKLLELIYSAIKKGSNLNDILPQLASTIDAMKNMPTKDYDKTIGETEEILQSISMDSSSIMMSLQVQDITAQQIAAVNNLLETVQVKLSTILNHFQTSEIGELVRQNDDTYDERINISKLHRNIAFDPEAVESIAQKAVRQGQVDQYIQEHSSGEINDMPDSPSQDDIDALFNQVTAVEPSEPVETPNNEVIEEVETADDPFEHFSQDDIDALFGK